MRSWGPATEKSLLPHQWHRAGGRGHWPLGPLLDPRDEQGPLHGAEMREGTARREETDLPSTLIVACSRDVQSQQVISSWAVGWGKRGTAVLPSGRFFQLLKIVCRNQGLPFLPCGS